jgi:starch phosphorylase
LSILHVIALYLRCKDGRDADPVPRTFVYGGKAAPGYRMAKLIIKLINAVGSMINRDPATRDRLRVVFVPNFSVRTGQRIYPCADLSEQISTAGKEASGTGNMKFTLNGALTIGTLDGANIEIRAEVGADNFFLFGLSAGEVAALKAQGYSPAEVYRTQPQLQEVIDLIASGFFSRGDGELFRPLLDSLLLHDPYLVLADFGSYVERHRAVADAYADRDRWTRMSILNVARCGKFSSDRAVREYVDDIWRAAAVPVRLISQDDIAGNLLQ